jgi:ribonuclease BN (tRNA processing enzyme)
MSNITILGAYGAKSDVCASSAFYLNRYNMLDAGNILRPLKEKSAEIETIWLTHSHLDHISDIAYILDNYYESRTVSLRLCGLKETLDTLKEHFFNHKIWPDFSTIPLRQSKEMSLIYEEVNLGEKYSMGNDESIEAFKTDHTVPSCGYIITKGEGSLLITADTHSLDSVKEALLLHADISAMVLECSFPSSMLELAKASKHLTPELLFTKLKPLEGKGLKLYINHLKPTYKEVITKEIEVYKGDWDTTILTDGDTISF